MNKNNHPVIAVSNPISGEVGAAAWSKFNYEKRIVEKFQTPSAGRWVLQLGASELLTAEMEEVSNPISGEVGAVAVEARLELVADGKFQTPSAGRWVLQQRLSVRWPTTSRVSNPISGEVGAAAPLAQRQLRTAQHVSNPISGEVGAAASRSSSACT